jgi:serine/threonine-protein kinase RsbW
MNGRARRRFAADMAALDEALEFVRDSCASFGIAPPDTLRLSLIVEELFTNTVRHGGGAATSIGLALLVDAGSVLLNYDDDTPAFNPLRAPAPDLDLPLELRNPGGLGIHLVRELSADVRYRYERGRNRLRLRLLTPPATPESR